jgi:DUF4097 and DUF4098 domain-containing protein YvlB
MKPRYRFSTFARLLACASTLTLGSVPIGAQTATVEPSTSRILGGRHAAPNASIKLFVPNGSVQLIGWARDSVLVRGTVPRGEKFYLLDNPKGIKAGIDEHADQSPVRPCQLVLYVPASSTVSLKTVGADISGTDVSGWFYTVSGAVRLTGSSRSIEIEDMNGDVDLDAAVPWAHVRTGDGRLLVRGAPQDLDAATITGPLDVSGARIVRGQLGSVSGAIRFTAPLPGDGILDFSNHAGSVDLSLPRPVSAVFALSTIDGRIDNALVDVRPAASTRGAGDAARRGGSTRSVRIVAGHGDAQVTVRTFKGMIHLSEY